VVILDNYTLSVTLTLVLILLVAITQVSRFSLEKAKGSGYWALANGCLAIGFILLSSQGRLNMFISVIVSNLFLLVGVVLLSNGVYLFFDSKPKTNQYLIILSFYLLSFVYYTYFKFHTSNRIIIISLMFGIIFFDIAYLIYKKIPIKRRGIFIYNVLNFTVLSGYYLYRAIATLRLPYKSSIFNSDMSLSIAFFMMMFGVLNWTLGLILMNSVRLEMELENNVVQLREENATRVVIEKQLKQTNLKLSEISIRDELTGLNNRRFIINQLRKEIASVKRHKTEMSVVIIDLDFFKRINDTYGHNIGDHVLVNLSDWFVHNLREVDYIGRYGGEEFMILLPNTNIELAFQLIERLRKDVESLDWPNIEYDITFSAGIVEVNLKNCNEVPNYLISLADQCLYEAKDKGRNRVEVYKSI